MSVLEGSSSRFVVFLDELFPRFWGHSREEAEERYREGRELLGEHTKVCTKKIDGDLFCPAYPGHNKPLLFEHDGWVSCPDCARPPY